ncbi:MAG TPA: hypothetical protein VF699_02865 [Caulobacteraceae bacterium]|jgi:hypothetical protein
MKRLLLALAGAAVLGGCATSYGAPHQPYAETRIAADRVRITYTGQRGEPPERVEDMALLRAADVAVQGGYSWFLVDNRFVERSRGYGYSNGPQISIGGSNVSFGRSSALSVGVGVGFNLGSLFGGEPAYGGRASSTIEVLLGRGTAPVGAYNAADVQRTIRGRLGYGYAPAPAY